jgi:hypothetical protein
MIEKKITKNALDELNDYKKEGKEITNELIREEVAFFYDAHSKRHPNAVVDLEKIVNDLESHFIISIGSSEVLYSQKTPWIRNYKQNNPNLSDFPFWNNYKRYLSEEKQLPENVIQEIDQSTDDILDGMTNPQDDTNFEKKGLVIGYVQSGKTGNYVGLINKAIDVGYQFIVVLAGMHNNLRQQTQMRIDEGVNGEQRVNGKITPVGVGTLHNRFNTQTQTLTTADSDGDFNSKAANMNGINFNIETPLIAVIKKNVHPLKNMNKWLENVIGINNLSKSNKAVLIIDDEADQASINNNFTSKDLDAPYENEDGTIDEKNTPTAINLGIVNLINKFSRRCYTGYTATPYANVLIPLDNEHHKSIFPEDFIVRLKQPSNYLGPEKYFEEKLPGVLEINKDEDFAEKIKQYYKDEIDELEVPESLKFATKQFIVSGGLRFYRGQQNTHMSMLIHVSHLTKIQNHLGEIFKQYWSVLKTTIENNSQKLWSELENICKGSKVDGLINELNSQKYYSDEYSANESFAKNNFDLPINFDELRDNIRSFIASIEILIVNGDKSNKGQSLDYHLYPHGRKVIAIGGNTMSRGLTLEGLHTSYFIRHAKTFDTLMQMGRWFGYRPNYADLCRIITTSEIAVDFSEICFADATMNENISAMIRSNATPRDFLIKIRQSTTSLAVTSKMGMAGEMQVSWAGGEVITNTIERKAETVIKNHKTLTDLIDKIKSHCNIDEFNNRLYFKKVSLDTVSTYINQDNYSVINNNGSLDLDKIFEFYKKSGYDTVDLVIMGRNPGKQSNFVFNRKELGLAKRNTARRNDEEVNINHFKVPNSKLTDADYLSNFIGNKKNDLSDKEKRSPSETCRHLKRPLITFLAFDPMYFYSKQKNKQSTPPPLDNMYEDFELLSDENTGKYEAIPYGISFATPLNLPNTSQINNKSVTVLVNQMVLDNAQ